MDVDPIQQLLKNTGWSCDDLLEKLQKYKSKKVPGEKESNGSSEVAEEKDTQECAIDSIREITEKSNPLELITKVPVGINEIDKSPSKVNDDIINSSNPIHSINNSGLVTEEFSDTDEEEVEVNVTSTNIINEIIDDIFTDNLEESVDTNKNCSYQSEVSREEEGSAEVMEVRVIEVNTDEDDSDDNFEEESSHVSEETYNSSHIEYLVTYPRTVSNNTNADPESQICESPRHKSNEDFKVNTTVIVGDKIEKPKSENEILASKSNLSLDNVKQNQNDDVQVEVVDPEYLKLGKPKIVDVQINLDKSNLEEITLSDTNLTPPVTDDNKNTNEDCVPENFEDIRNNLKLQLSCLRTRKKGHFLKEMRSNVVDEVASHKMIISTENLNNNNTVPKAQFKSKPECLESKFPVTDSKNEALIEINTDSDSLYTQTNEFGLVILNVQGGIEIDEEGERRKDDEISKKNISEDMLNESSSNTNFSLLDNSGGGSILPEDSVENDEEITSENGVLDEIRKIIRKQRCNSNRRKDIETKNKTPERRNSVNNFGFLFNSSEFQMNIESNPDTECASAENSLPSFTTGGNNETVAKNSPFFSNTLDEFLGNAKLNISYNVPKCGAEEGLKETYEESPLVLRKVVKIEDEDKPKPKNMLQTIKAKTVAQKRKLLEKQKKMELKKQLQQRKPEKNESPTKSEKYVKRETKDSYVMLSNKKIWVKGMKPNSCIAKINVPKESPVRENVVEIDQKPRKPSLLTDLGNKFKEEVVYRPGPMSKKPELQVSGQDNWTTQTKTLPKLFIDIVPGIGKPIASNILSRLPQCYGKLSNTRVEFALSVLKTKNDEIVKPNAFRFPVKYHNGQEKIVVRKVKVSSAEYTVDERNKPKSDNEIVADVLEGLIKYVEIKEIAPTLIKEEENVENINSDDKFTKMPAISDSVSNIFKKPHKRRSRVELELCRLSCKVVNVEIEENVEAECYKPYCRLGCICKSLKCERGVMYHCGKVKCMLECSCPIEKSYVYDKLTLPAGTDILSTDAVNRIEDEAKKDLAKVEREFTQTVIHTSDKTIVVGLGGRNKSRRMTKAPKKYSDYVDSFEAINEEVKIKEENKKADFSRKCFVNLQKLDLAEIVPYCLIHNLYRCHCQGYIEEPVDEAVTTPDVSKTISTKAKRTVVNNTEKPVIKKRTYVSKKVRKFTNPQPTPPISESEEPKVVTSNETLHSETVSDTEVPINKRPIRLTKKIKLKQDFSYSDEVSFYSSDCARVGGISRTDLYNRRYNLKQRNVFIKNDFVYNLTDADIMKAKIYSNAAANTQMLEVDLLKYFLINEAMQQRRTMPLVQENPYNEKSKHKRKQTLEIRNDYSSNQKLKQDMAIQRRKKQLLRKNDTIEAIFDGEIIIDSRNMELLQKMGPRTVSDGYARLLPWKALIESFKMGTINIWSMVDQPSRLLINKSDKLPPKNYVNITDSTAQAGDVSVWILNNKLPSNYQGDNVSFILKQTKDNYEICGLCTKNLTDDKTFSKSESGVEIPNSRTMTFNHKDLNGESQILLLTKQICKLQELIEENMAGIGETSIEKSKMYMWAALPEIHRVCKWRMIFLNSDFTYLYFTALKYSIKYTDLLNAGNIAKNGNSTVMLRNQRIENGYNHKAFGIYFDPHYQDRLFIGPYFKQHNEDDVETLRYINKSLVCTESFNKMQGKIDYKCGHWLIERPYGRMRRCFESEQTIDLTNDDNPTSPRNKRRHSLDSSQVTKKPRYDLGEQVIMHNKGQIRVIDGEPRKPEDFNRYIITNIPLFGYLGAYQHEDNPEIDVSWPFENKLLRFPNVTTAINFLQDRFSSLLQPIPESFKINVIILNHIDLQNCNPINASILSGHYICGNFGCYNVKVIKNEFCIDKLGMSREALLRIFARRAQAFVRKKVEELADLLNIHNEVGRYDIINILETGRNEINSQLRLEKENTARKNQLLLEKRELALKVFCLISTLPEREKEVENWKFKRILTNSMKPITTNTDPIEIPDSDEEKPMGDSINESLPTNDKPVDDTAGIASDSMATVSDNTKSDKKDAQRTSKIILLSAPDGSQAPKLSTPKTVTIASKIAEASKFSPVPNIKLKSVLKSNVGNPLSRVEPIAANEYMSLLKNSSPPKPTKTPTKPQYITGVKIVKTQSGKLMLVSDKEDSNMPFKGTVPSQGTQVVIRNNQVVSVKRIEGDAKDSVSVLDKLTKNHDLASESDSDSPNIDNLSVPSDKNDCIRHCSISNESVKDSEKEVIDTGKAGEEVNVDTSVPPSRETDCEDALSDSVLTDEHTKAES